MNVWRIILWLSIVACVLMFLWLVRSVLPPFIVALVIAALLEPLVRKLRRKGVSRPLAVVAVLTVFFALFGTVAAYTGVQVKLQYDAVQVRVIEQINNISSSNPDAVLAPVDDFLLKNKANLEKFNLPTNRQGFVSKYIEPNRKQVEKATQTFLTGGFFSILSFAGQAFMFLLVPIFVFGILVDIENLRKGFARFIPPALRGTTLSMLGDIGQVFENYLRGLAITVTLYTILMGTILGVMGAPYFIILAIIAGILYLIPVIGGIISSVSIFLIIALSGVRHGNFAAFDNSWTFATATVALMFVFGFVYDSVVNPRIVGKAVNLNPVLSAFVVFSAGALFGLPGMLLAYPVAGAIKVVLDRLVKFTGSTEGGIKLPAVPLRHRQATEA